MRIGFVETNAHGGLLHYSVQLCDALAARGNDVVVLLPDGHELDGHVGAATLRPVLTPHVRTTSAAPRHPVVYQLRRGVIAVRLLRSLARAVVAVRRERFDAVLLHWDLTFGIVRVASRLLQRMPGRPTLGYVLHNVRPFNRWGGEDLFLSPGSTDRFGRALSGFDVVFVHGDRAEAEFRRLYPPAHLVVVPHGDERVFGEPPPPSDEERVLFFGDWRKIKGLDVLMSAFDIVARNRPLARLTIAGTPAPSDFDDSALRRWAAERVDAVTLIDQYVPVEDVRDVFASARVVCTPYLAGFQSGVVHLAMTMGRAVVTSDVGDLPAAVGEDGGVVVPAGDAAALAAALELVLADRELADRMGEVLRRRAASSSSWETAAEKVEQGLAGLTGTRT